MPSPPVLGAVTLGAIYLMSRIVKGSRIVEYWTGHTWTRNKAEAQQYESQQAGFDEKDRAGLNMPVNVNKE